MTNPQLKGLLAVYKRRALLECGRVTQAQQTPRYALWFQNRANYPCL